MQSYWSALQFAPTNLPVLYRGMPQASHGINKLQGSIIVTNLLKRVFPIIISLDLSNDNRKYVGQLYYIVPAKWQTLKYSWIFSRSLLSQVMIKWSNRRRASQLVQSCFGSDRMTICPRRAKTTQWMGEVFFILPTNNGNLTEFRI